ncbi:S-adenosyl-L-methionine-dependent methyltransferase [Biscogniauxia marginata]|nr:S-adenosyl-L-methionine-dependent methyltransferase [Biscogniauxia marginata]
MGDPPARRQTGAGSSAREGQTPPAPSDPQSQGGGVPSDDEDDADSALGDDNASSTASLSASILEYRTLHGRTYHSLRGNAEYWGPNDDQASESMDLTHHMLTMLLEDKLFLAPIGDNPKKVLDIGCGTGVWAIDFADAFPSSEVIGTDISPTQPAWVPANLRFEMDDCTQEWTFAPSSFDFIHIRYLFGSIVDWEALYAEAFRACTAGGYLEAVEAATRVDSDDGSVAPGMALHDFGPLFHEAGRKIGRSTSVVEDGVVARAVRAAGFVDVVERSYKVPLTPWPADERLRQVGLYARLATEQGLEGFVLYLFTTILGWSPEEVQVYVARARRELRDKKIKPYFLVQVVHGRKPEDA